MKSVASNISLNIEDIGGKAYNLLRLKKLGFNVPAFVILDKSFLLDHLTDDFENVDAQINSINISNQIFELVNTSIDQPKKKLFAVRSSGVQEDGQSHSFAGQFESFLYVQYEDIPKFVKEVWRSNFSKRVEAYFKNNNIERQYGIGVVIQEMIDPEVSGVAFGVNPNTGTENSKAISAVYGVGEGLVSGALNADTFLISGDKIDSEILRKDQAARRAASGKVELVPVDKDIQNNPSLNEQQIWEIGQILDDLKSHLNQPQDIEFAIKNEEIFLLQTRPVTAVFKKSEFKTEGLNRIIWDNSNIIESYPGVTTPLTFSYILNAYRQVYAQLAMIFGVSKKKIARNKGTFEHMLGLINGRVYYNLFNWYRMLALFPGYKLNARFMENMMGVKERFDLPKEDNDSKLSALFRTVWMVIRILGHMFTIKRQTKKYLADVDRTIKAYKALDLEKMTAFELKEKWVKIEAYLTSRWRAPILTDSFALYYFGKLQKKIEKYQISENPNLHNDLLCGSQDIISVEPIHRTIALASAAGENEALTKLYKENSPEEIWTKLQNGANPEHLHALNQFLEDFGDRCVGELKLETISYKQDPTMYVATIKSFVEQGVTTANTSSSIDKELRSKAEATVKKALKYRPLRRWRFMRTLKKTRFLVSNRENLRYERTRAFGLTREMFAQIGKEFEKAGVLDSYRDVFYLTMQEMFGYIEASSVDTDLKALTSMRKKEYQQYKEMDPPAERFTTFGVVNYGNNFFDTSIEDSFDGDLKGIGCCPGLVKAKVQVIRDPKEVSSLNGDILVTSSTDPGWVTLFPTCSAIIVERGSLLSHSAIVSREMGIPCIVSVTGLLKTLKTGDLIEMDGSTGQIKILADE